MPVRADFSQSWSRRSGDGWGRGLWEDRGPGERLNKGIREAKAELWKNGTERGWPGPRTEIKCPT